MILDDFQNAERYAALHPGIAAGMEQLRRPDLPALAPGRYNIDGERLVLIIGQDPARGREGARLEVHRRYLDIQYSLLADELIGWRPLHECLSSAGPFDDARDIQFFEDTPLCWLAVPTGKFAIFFPEDAHAPLAGQGLLHKAVVKVAMDYTA